MITWIVSGIVVLIAALSLWSVIRDKKSGKGSCDGNCQHCSRCNH